MRWLTPILLLLVVWGLGHSSFLLTRVGNYVLGGLVTEGSTLSVGRIEGSAFSELSILDLKLASPADSTFLEIDSIHVRFSLTRVLGGNLEAVTAANLIGQIGRRSGGDMILPDWQQTEGGSSNFSVELAAIQSFRMRVLQGDSVLAEIRDGGFDARSIQIGQSVGIAVDTLWAKLYYPFSPIEGLFASRFTLDVDHQVALALNVSTEKSQLVMDGHAALDSLSETGFSDWVLNASGSLTLADLEPFIPGLSKTEVWSIDAETTDHPDSTSIFARLSSLQSGQLRFQTSSKWASDSLFHSFSGRIENFNPGRSHIDLEMLSGINGSVLGAFSGPSYDESSGWARLELNSGRFDSLTVEPSFFKLDKKGQLLEGMGSIALSAGRLDVSGSYENDRFEANGDLSGFDAALVQMDLPPSDLNARFSVNGTLGDGALRSAIGRVEFGPSSIASCDIREGLIAASFTDQEATIESTLSFCANAPLTSRISIQDPLGNWTIAAFLGVRGLRLSEAMNMDSPLYLSAEARVNYDKKERISGELQVNNIQMGSLMVDSAIADFKGTLNRMTIDANMAIGGGRISASARLLNQSTFEIESGLVDQIDPFSIAAPDSLETKTNSSALNGTFSGVINLASGAPLGSVNGAPLSSAAAGTGSFALTLHDSRLNRQKFDAQIDADFSEAALEAKLWVTTPQDGSVDGRVDWSQGAEKIDAALQFRHLDMLAWANIEGKSNLNGSFNGNVNLLGDMPFVSSIALIEGSELNDIALESLSLEASGKASAVNFGVNGSAKLNLANGSAEASFSASENSAEGDLRIQNADIAAMLGVNSASSVTTSARIEASKSAKDWDRFSIQVDSVRGHFEHLQLNQGIVDATLGPNGLQIDTLRLNGSFGHLKAEGYLPRRSNQPDANLTFDVSINSEVERLSQMKALGAGFGSFLANGTLIGPAGGIRLNAEYVMTEPSILPVEANNIKGRLLGELGEDWGLSAAELVAELSLVELSPVVAQKAVLSVSYDGSEVLTSVQILFSEAREVNAAVSWFPSDVPAQVALVEFSANFDSDVWSMSGTPTFDLENRVLTRPLLLSSGNQRIVAVTSTSADQVRNLITIQELRIDPFADLMAYPDLGGVLGGTLTSTTQPDSAGNSAGLYIQGSLNGSLSAYNQSAGNVNLQFLDDGRETQLNARLTNSETESLHLVGSLPRLDSGDAVQIELTASAYSIDWIRSLLDPELVDDLKGQLDGQVLITGTPTEPYWSGMVRLENGQIGMPLLGKRKGMIVNSIQANFLFDGEVVTVDSMLARSGDGRLRGSGTIDIKDLKLGEYNISLTAEDFKAIDSHDYFAVVSGQMSLGGTTDRPKLGGRITVHRGDFWLTDATTGDVFLPLALSDEDLATLQRRFGLRIAANDTTSFDAYDVLALEDFTVRMERDSWIRSKSNPKMDIQLTGDLDVRKKPKADPEVFGSISILPERSRIIQFGKRFELDRGELTFNGPMTAPNLNMEASYTIPSRGSETEEVTIRLIANGSPDDLDVTFDSEPSMELADIFSYIATGRPAAASLQISGAQSDSYLESAAGLALGPVTDLIENLAGAGLGLDVIEIEHTGFSGLTLTAGKYVSPKLYVSVSQPISLSSSAEGTNAVNKNQTQVTIEYELVRQLLMNLVNRGTILRVNLRWQLAF